MRIGVTIPPIFLALAGGLAPAQENASSEYQVKAAFLYHFSQFVDWPEERWETNAHQSIAHLARTFMERWMRA
jgi:hypothetical protein